MLKAIVKTKAMILKEAFTRDTWLVIDRSFVPELFRLEKPRQSK